MNATAEPLLSVVRPTTVLRTPRLSQRLNAEVTLVSETFQHTGSFKFRAAYNVAAQVAQRRIITASSGNFGQALAYACSLLGKEAIVVMPSTAAGVKIRAVREYGATVELIDVNEKRRAQRVAELARDFPDAYIASAYDDPLVIAGNASLGQEIARLDTAFDAVIVPVGGGGLSSGLIQGLRGSGSTVSIIGAEPLLANDAARSLQCGCIVANGAEPQTLADGARTLSLGRCNWEILHKNMDAIIEVPEAAIAEGVRLLFELANLKAEPTAALAIGALLAEPRRFQQRSLCCVISGGNVDPLLYRELLT
ncbi:threonine/serine dehydratase [Candidatus Methylospira mobilis]|uniref:Threonine/serine dehydratase n=1 Tax=Candidatus Methylospira mobilis TaxID=1808979 RepID=A0A5Q0BLR3_9GAMM|nr:threonine/serine dehydratase [Candidatus Methylospira mobilis]QFY42696.1 threonine/serine dehydratase [Candidatus Methylospira mobilis]WNV04185.1 threonine/serine dehydratase [Candidatus Methylospira mobilis]